MPRRSLATDMGLCNWSGIRISYLGVEQDFAKGAAWTHKAAVQGHATAQYMLGWITTPKA